MPKMTLQQRAVRFLVQCLGAQEDPKSNCKHTTRKFRVRNTDAIYYVGKNGGVRVGKNKADSVSVTATTHSNMKLWERRNGL